MLFSITAQTEVLEYGAEVCNAYDNKITDKEITNLAQEVVSPDDCEFHMPQKYGRSQTLVHRQESSFSISFESIVVIAFACVLIICFSLLVIWCRIRSFSNTKNDTNSVVIDVSENLEVETSKGIMIFCICSCNFKEIFIWFRLRASYLENFSN